MPAMLLDLRFHLRVVGVLLLLVAGMHAFVPARFAWRSEISRLSPVNQRILVSHCIFIVLLVLLTGILATFFAPLLLNHTPLAQLVLAGMSIFWLAKLAGQVALFSSGTARSGRFGLATHVLFCCLWSYIGGVCLVAWILS